jgi:hypothetical protein
MHFWYDALASLVEAPVEEPPLLTKVVRCLMVDRCRLSCSALARLPPLRNRLVDRVHLDDAKLETEAGGSMLVAVLEPPLRIRDKPFCRGKMDIDTCLAKSKVLV